MKKRCKQLGVLLLGLTLLTGAAGCGSGETGAYEQAMEALDAGNYALAEQEFEEAEQTEDRQAEIARGRGILCLAQQQYEEAYSYFQQALDAAGKSDKAFQQDVKLYMAETCLEQGDTEQAETICLDLLEESESSQARLLLGRISLSKGDAEAADEYFTASLEQDQSFENYLTIYELYADASMEANGAAYLEQALQLVPSGAEDYCSQGQIYYYLGQTEDAKTSFARAIDLGSVDAVPLMGKLYLENGEIQAARSMYQSYLEQAVQPAVAYNGLALCDMEDGDYDSALTNIASGLAQDEEEVRESLLLNEIACYEYKLDFETAKEKMEAFLAEYPDNEDAVRENIFLQSR